MNIEVKTRKELPIAALLFGLTGLHELGWALAGNVNISPCGSPITEGYCSIPSVLGLALGFIALGIQNNWTAGKRLAILGVIASIPGSCLTIASFNLCGPTPNIVGGRESAAIQTLRTFHTNQAQFLAIHSRFGTMKELAATGLIDSNYASGLTISGYAYSTSDVSAETYCVHASRAADDCGSRDFIVCEDGVIRFVESETKIDIRPGEGTPLSGIGPP